MTDPTQSFEDPELLTWGSHLHLLKKLFAQDEIKSVIEFGGGNFSTPFFVDNCDRVLSVEHDSKWAEMMKEKYGQRGNLEVVDWKYNDRNPYAPDEVGFNVGFFRTDIYLDKYPPEKFDLMFIDGPHETRAPCFNKAAKWADDIRPRHFVLHDAESWDNYRYDTLEIPEGYELTIDKVHPSGKPLEAWAALITSKKDLLL